MAIQSGFQSMQLTLGFRYVSFAFYFVICKFIAVFKVESTCIGLGGNNQYAAVEGE